MNNKMKIIFGVILLAGILLVTGVDAYSRANPQVSSFGGGSQSYLAGQGIQLFPSSFGVGDQCGAGQDFVLQIHPFGCSPSVVPSDLLEEQNVPVFCPIVATQVNPLIDIKAIDSMTFSGPNPEGVSGIGFHPARAAVRSEINLLNYPILENVGYAVIVLKRQQNASSIPDSVEGNLTANIKYDIKNAFGVGDSTFNVPQLSNSEWEQRFKEFNFWSGRGYIRASDVRNDQATIQIYEDQNRRISSFTLKPGETSSKVYLSGAYCLSGLQIKLDALENPGTRVRLKIDDDYREVKIGEGFLENRCSVKTVGEQGIVKSTSISCRDDKGDRKTLNFALSPRVIIEINGEEKNFGLGDQIEIDGTDYYLTHIDSKSNIPNNENLFVWFAKLSDADKKRFVSETRVDGKDVERLNTEGLFNFHSYVISRQSVDLADGKLTGRELWKASFGNEIKLDNFESRKVKLIGFAGFEKKEEVTSEDPQYSEENYSNSISSYDSLTQKYPSVGQADKYGTQVEGAETYSEKGLKEAIELSGDVRDYTTRDRLIRILEQKYPTRGNQLFIEEKVGDYVNANKDDLIISDSVFIDGRYRTITFVDVYEPNFEDYGVEIRISGEDFGDSNVVQLTSNVPSTLVQGKTIELVDLKEDQAVFTTNIESTDSKARSRVTLKLNQVRSFTIGKDKDAKKLDITLTKINLNKVAKVSVLSNIDRAGTTADIGFKIGIEKSAVDLSPERMERMIENLNESVQEWEERSEKLGEAVDGLQKACLATVGVLTVKNLLLEGGGSVKARKKTMEFVRDECNKKVATGEYRDTRECINSEGELIESVQEINKRIINDQDALSDKIREDIDGESDSFFDKRFKERWIEKKRDSDPNFFNEENLDHVSISELQEYDNCLELEKTTESQFDSLRERCVETRTKLLERVQESVSVEATRKAAEEENERRGFANFPVSSYADPKAQEGIWQGKTLDASKISGYDGSGVKKVEFITFGGVEYLAILRESKKGSSFSPEHVYRVAGKDNGEVTVDSSDDIRGKFRTFRRVGSFEIPIDNPQVRYFGAPPDKDLPAIVPFPFPGRANNGYYVGVRHLVVGSQYAASGAPKSYYVCNAVDGEIDFNPESKSFVGQDECVQVRLVGTSLVGPDKAFDLTEPQTRDLLVKAGRALIEAERKFGDTGVGDILGMAVKFGEPVFSTPQLQCQDYMSPSDCAWLFNLCDPVICPSSRCDFGGIAPQANPVQSGIVGSLLLCLPNFGSPSEGGVVVPVCLTGLKAGIDGYTSVIRAHRDCLVEKLETGRNIGICEEVYSVRVCELFWQNAAPFKDVIIPKILQFFTSGSVRGGGEYLNAVEAWNNARNTLTFFGTTYAQNAYNAFQVQSVDQLQNTFCKNSISAVIPEIGVLDSLSDPASPPQYHAKFEEVPFTDATVPPTSQYSVFYHIFAGKTSGVNYQVYLKASSDSISIFSVNPINVVDTGFLPLGESVTQKKDFTAPSGYRELCVRVNNQEECGFDLVSTSFAADFIKDQYLADQAQETDITTESECVSGGHDVSSLVNQNLQGGLTEFLNPDIYKKGITRICSTSNPGGSNHTRWKDVGYCDDPKLRCWIDTDTVKEAIDFKNLEDKTLEEVSASDLDRLTSEGFLRLDDYQKEVESIKSAIVTQKELESSIKKIDDLMDGNVKNKEVLWDWQKAELLYLKANVYRVLSKEVFNVDRASKQGILTTDDPIRTKTGEGTEVGDDVEAERGEIEGQDLQDLIDRLQEAEVNLALIEDLEGVDSEEYQEALEEFQDAKEAYEQALEKSQLEEPSELEPTEMQVTLRKSAGGENLFLQATGGDCDFYGYEIRSSFIGFLSNQIEEGTTAFQEVFENPPSGKYYANVWCVKNNEIVGAQVRTDIVTFE